MKKIKMDLRGEIGLEMFKNAPWASRAEWNEVYKDAFSSKYEDWVNAKTLLEMWKVRVPHRRQLIGISCTLDVVNAQLALCDAYGSRNPQFRGLDDCFRNDLFNLYIASFVTTATKCLKNRHNVEGNLNAVAKKIGLPEFLVDIRNQLIHKEADYILPDTKHDYLKAARDWIKSYWDYIAEENKAKEKKFKKGTKKIKIKLKEASFATDSCEVKSKKLIAYIADRVALITTHCKRFKYDDKEIQIINGLNEALVEYASEYPEDAMNILVTNLFFAPQVINRMDRTTKMHHSPHCKLKSHSIKFIFKLAVSHLLTVIKIKAINIFINALIEQGKNCPETASGWIRVMANLTHANTEESKIFLKATKIRITSFSMQMRWKEQHLYTLLTLDEKWANDLGLELCKRNSLNVSKDKLKILKELVSINRSDHNCINLTSKLEVDPKMSVEKCISNIATLNVVVEQARKVSPGVSEYVQELCDQVTGNHDDGSNKEKVVPLGVLPHLADDECLHKMLRLPDIDLSKRKKWLRHRHVDQKLF